MPMDLDRQANEIIEEAEKKLATLASEAAARREYGRASTFLAMAQRVADAGRSNGSATVAPISPPDSGGAGFQVTTGTKRTPSSVVSPASERLQSPVRKHDGTSYPRFKRENDTLVKIGWSKSDRATYEHRSPRDILTRLVTAVKRFSSGGERFTTEDLMPLHDDQGAELPSYQSYLCLAWMVVAGILEKHGRQGYTVKVAGDLDAAVEAAWQELPRR